MDALTIALTKDPSILDQRLNIENNLKNLVLANRN
jgi:hypothetical protein